VYAPEGKSIGVVTYTYSVHFPNPDLAQQYFHKIDRAKYGSYTFSAAPLGRFSITIDGTDDAAYTALSVSTAMDDVETSTFVEGPDLTRLQLLQSGGLLPTFTFKYHPWLRSSDITRLEIREEIFRDALVSSAIEAHKAQLGTNLQAYIEGFGINFNTALRRHFQQQTSSKAENVNSDIEVTLVYNSTDPLFDVDFGDLLKKHWERSEELAAAPSNMPIIDLDLPDAPSPNLVPGMPGVAIAYTNDKGEKRYRSIETSSFVSNASFLEVKVRTTDDIAFKSQPQGFKKVIGSMNIHLLQHHTPGHYTAQFVGAPGELVSQRETTPKRIGNLSQHKNLYYRFANTWSDYRNAGLGDRLDLYSSTEHAIQCGKFIVRVPHTLAYGESVPRSINDLLECKVTGGNVTASLPISESEQAWPKDLYLDDLTVQASFFSGIPADSPLGYKVKYYGFGSDLKPRPREQCFTSNPDWQSTSDRCEVGAVLIVYSKEGVNYNSPEN